MAPSNLTVNVSESLKQVQLTVHVRNDLTGWTWRRLRFATGLLLVRLGARLAGLGGVSLDDTIRPGSEG